MGGFDFVLGFCKVIASSVSAETKAVLFNVAGPAGSIDVTNPDGDDEAGETASSQEGYTALGIVARPRAPSKVNGQTVNAEGIGARTLDGLVPFAWRDLRLNAVYSAPKEGSVALVGYGGGFHAIEDTSSNSGDQKSSIHIIYAPYQYTAGVPAKAHAIMIDTTPGNECVSLVHGDGHSIDLKKDKEVVVGIDASTFFSMKPGEFSMSSAKILLKGNVYLGRAAEGGLPLSPSTNSPSVFASTL